MKEISSNKPLENNSETNEKLRSFSKHPSTFVSKFQVMNLVYQLCTQNKFSTKRDLYYCNKPILKDQTQLDTILKDISTSWGVNRHDLHVVPQSKGELFGPIQWKQVSLTDIELKGVGRIVEVSAALGNCYLPSIPHLQIVDFTVPLALDKIIIVEKESVFQVLKDQYYSLQESSLLITSKGYPDVPTRDFIVTLVKYIAKYQKRAINIYILTDGDPYGAEIANVYINGSASFENEKKTLTLHSCVSSEAREGWEYWILQTYSRMKWVGVHVNDFDNSDELFNKWKHCWLPLDELDLKKVNSILETSGILDLTIKEHIESQQKSKMKVEIEALNFLEIEYWDYIQAKVRCLYSLIYLHFKRLILTSEIYSTISTKLSWNIVNIQKVSNLVDVIGDFDFVRGFLIYEG